MKPNPEFYRWEPKTTEGKTWSQRLGWEGDTDVTYSNVGETDHSGLPKTGGDGFQEVGLSVLKLDQS